MEETVRLVEVTEDNLDEHPQVICFINPKHPQYGLKVQWLKEQFRLGLKIKLLYLSSEKKPVGFIEYTPGEQCWRAVEAKDYLFIHCLWTNGKKHQHQGLGQKLVEAVEADVGDRLGVAVMTSDKAFMANRSLFLKRGYQIVQEHGSEQLLVKTFREGPRPSIQENHIDPNHYPGLTLVYSRQCPWVARFMEEAKPIWAERGLDPTVIELTTATEAQKAPSVYGCFSLLFNGRLLADRYISTTRLKNILDKAMTS